MVQYYIQTNNELLVTEDKNKAEKLVKIFGGVIKPVSIVSDDCPYDYYIINILEDDIIWEHSYIAHKPVSSAWFYIEEHHCYGAGPTKLEAIDKLLERLSNEEKFIQSTISKLVNLRKTLD